jgi:Flp pilus assembly protein TadD
VLERRITDADLARYEGALVVKTVEKEQISRLHIGLAMLLAANNQTDEALEHCNTAIELNPKDPRAYHRRAQLLDAVGEHEKARLDYERAAALGEPASTRGPVP